jgi:hypothetical protein
MAFPFNYKQIVSSNNIDVTAKVSDNDLYTFFRQKINMASVSDWSEAESGLSFVSRNSLFGIHTFMQLKWQFKPMIHIEITFDMDNFLRLLSLVAIVVGLLGKMSFQHYILISFFIIVVLFLINFSILKIYSKRLINDAMAFVVPENLSTEIGLDEKSFFSDYSVSRENSDIHYQTKDNSKSNSL